MGQRMIQLENTYAVAKDGSVTVHCSQMPPNPHVFAPGPAMMFVVVQGVPSVATPVMIGSGKIEKQPVLAVTQLPSAATLSSDSQPPNNDSSSDQNDKSPN